MYWYLMRYVVSSGLSPARLKGDDYKQLSQRDPIKKMMGKLQTFAKDWAYGASGTLTHKECNLVGSSSSWRLAD